MLDKGTHLLRRKGCFISFTVSIIILACFGGLVLATTSLPAVGAEGADLLRGVFGDEAVAKLEETIFKTQDAFQQIQCKMGLCKAESPWQVAVQKYPKAVLTPTQKPHKRREQPVLEESPLPGDQTVQRPTLPGIPLTVTPTIETAPIPPAPSNTPAPTAWMPAAVTPLGTLQGEGVWQPYIQNKSGQVVAYRTYVQPDPERPYAVVGIVAFDLTSTRLHYVLGTIEPQSADKQKRPGIIAPEDLKPDVLLATFNGGFKATHGKFGAMADGVIALLPREGLGTVAIYPDGKVAIGEWGTEINPDQNFVAWRQNGPLVIHNGQINERIYNNSPKDWGYTVDDVSPTWRSGLGISADGNTLYYLAGPKLTMEALAKSMLAAGMVQGIQLDINNYWVHFVAIRSSGNGLTPEPLFPEAMNQFVDRYLHPYSRDFFYVTAAAQPGGQRK